MGVGPKDPKDLKNLKTRKVMVMICGVKMVKKWMVMMVFVREAEFQRGKVLGPLC